MHLEFYTTEDLIETVKHDWVQHGPSSYPHKVNNGDKLTLYLVEGEFTENAGTFWKVGITKESNPLARDRKHFKRVLASNTFSASQVSDTHTAGNVTAIEGFVCGKCKMHQGVKTDKWDAKRLKYNGGSEVFVPHGDEESIISKFNTLFYESLGLVEEHGVKRYQDEHHFVWIYRAAIKTGFLKGYWDLFKPESKKAAWLNLMKKLLGIKSIGDMK